MGNSLQRAMWGWLLLCACFVLLSLVISLSRNVLSTPDRVRSYVPGATQSILQIQLGTLSGPSSLGKNKKPPQESKSNTGKDGKKKKSGGMQETRAASLERQFGE